MEEKNTETIQIPKQFWEDLIDAYDRQNKKFVSVFKTITICITILIAIWFSLYFFVPKVNQNNGIIQNGNNNTTENTTISNGGQ